MYDYDYKEEVSPSMLPDTRTSMTTTIDFVYSPKPRSSDVDMNKTNNPIRFATATSTIGEDMKSNDASDHACENPTAFPYLSSSSLLSSQAEESIETPIISNRPMQREAPPILCLPPTLSSPNHLRYDNINSSNEVNTNHQVAVDSTYAQETTSKNKSPRFSSINDAPIIMSGIALERWSGKQKKNVTTKRCDTVLSERLPTIVDLVTFSNYDGSSASPAALVTDIVRYSIESMVQMGLFFTMNRIKRTLFESNASGLQRRQNMNNSNTYKVPVAASSSDDCLQQNATYIRTRAPTHVDPHTHIDHNHNKKSMLHGKNSAKLPKPNKSKSVMLSTTTMGASVTASLTAGCRSYKKVVGIRNYGQTCFLNSVIQALASLDPFITYLERSVRLNVKHQNNLQMTTATSYLSDLDDGDDDGRNCIDSYIGRLIQSRNTATSKRSTLQRGDKSKKSLFCEDMLNLLMRVNGENQQGSSRQWIDPRPVLLAVGQKHKQFQRRYGGVGVVAVGEQQDAQELLQAVLAMIIDESRFDLTPSAVPSTITSSFVENTNSDIEGDGGENAELGEESAFLHKNIAMNSISKAMEIMMTTTSSISPCPLSIWCGSALMCSTCRQVRPIQNVPFLDIPIIPTSISHQMMHPPQKGQDSSSCRLEDCLSEFTDIERVFDVECKNCTIQAEIKEQESDREFQLQIIDGIRSRQFKANVKSSGDGDCGSNNQTKHILDDLIAIETQLEYLSRLSPDDDRPLYKGMTATTSIVGLVETPATPTKIPFKRSDAFKCLLLTRLPSILSIHVQRRYFDPNTGKSSKTMQHISFPEMLDVSSFCAYGAPKRHHSSFAGTRSINQARVLSGAATSMPIWYKLMAVIEHRGGPYSGHYVCYRRDPSSAVGEDRWLWISDDTVRVCQWSNVRNCQAYMLFYEAT